MVRCCFCWPGDPAADHPRCSVVLLDDTQLSVQVRPKTRGQELLDEVFQHLNLLETAYFGLRYVNRCGESRWLDPQRKVCKQLKGLPSLTVYLGVKFYPSDPCKLNEEITRYQVVLQLKQDILQGRLPVPLDLASVLFALSLQAELGDYDPRKHHKGYVSEFQFLPEQTPDLEEKVEHIHKTLTGQVPSSVEMTFLEKAKWLELYGIDMHPVMGDDRVEYILGLTPSGIVVMKNRKKISSYYWPRISKIFFKGKCFMIRVRDKSNEETTYGFVASTREACEYLWKCCVEHHAFFRLTQVKDVSGNPMQLFRLGSKYRYSGRTEQQVLSETAKTRRPPPTILRVPSRRIQKRTGQPDGAEGDYEAKEEPKSNFTSTTKDDLAIPCALPSAPLYRSVSTPAVLAELEKQENVDSRPPWEDPDQKGLFGSRQSLASSRGSERRSSHRSRHRRSGSVDSSDSKRRRHHSSRRCSDNESDISRSSRCSRSSRNGRNRSRESGSDSDSRHRSRRKKHRRSSNGIICDLVPSEEQWRMVQQQQQERAATRMHSAVVRDLSKRKSGYVNSGIDTESEAPRHHRRKHRRHSRSRSRSPDSNPVLSHEIKQHIEYSLIDPTNLTEEEKRDIKYTKVESDSLYRIRYSPSSNSRPRYKVTRVSSRSSLERAGRKADRDEDPPLGYSHAFVNGDLLVGQRNGTAICKSTVIKMRQDGSSGSKTNSNQTSNSQQKSLAPSEKCERRKNHETSTHPRKKTRDRSTEL